MTICGKQGLYTLRTSVKHGAPRPAAAARSRGRAPRPHAADGTVGGLSAPESRPGLNTSMNNRAAASPSRHAVVLPALVRTCPGTATPGRSRTVTAGVTAGASVEPSRCQSRCQSRFLQFLITVIRGPRMLPQWRTKAGHQFLIYMMANVDECQGLFLVY